MPTAQTFREDLIDRFRARLAEIQTANDFFTNAGARLYIDEVPTLGPDDPPDAIVLLVGDDTVRYSENEKTLIELPIDISAIVRVDVADGWRTREWILADIKKAIELQDRTLGGLLGSSQKNLKRSTTRSMRREVGSTVMGTTVRYLVTYGEPWGGHVQL